MRRPPLRLFLGELGHELLEQFAEPLFTFFEGVKIRRECFFGAERFSRTVRLNRAIVDSATEIEQFASELTEKIDKIRPGKTLELSAGSHADTGVWRTR